MAVEVKRGGKVFEAATPRALFTTSGIFGNNVPYQYVTLNREAALNK